MGIKKLEYTDTMDTIDTIIKKIDLIEEQTINLIKERDEWKRMYYELKQECEETIKAFKN